MTFITVMRLLLMTIVTNIKLLLMTAITVVAFCCDTLDTIMEPPSHPDDCRHGLRKYARPIQTISTQNQHIPLVVITATPYVNNVDTTLASSLVMAIMTVIILHLCTQLQHTTTYYDVL